MSTPQPADQPPDQPSRDSLGHRAARLGGGALALALFAAGMWFAWLGWDDEYHLVDGVPQGPYRTWQVLGCGVSIAAAAVIVHLWVRGRWAVLVLTAAAVLGFAVPWTAHAAATDDSGLFVVGLFFLLVGGGTGLVLLLTLAEAIAPRRRTGPRTTG